MNKISAVINSAFKQADSMVVPQSTDKEVAVELARKVMRYQNHGLALMPSEALILAREYLRALHLER